MRKGKGFTLIELLVTLAVVAIVMTVAVPSFMDLVRSNRLAAQTNDLVTAINLARSEAIKRNAQVSLCASSDQSTCTGGTDWTVGWIAFRDTGSGGSPTVDEVLQVWESRADSLVLDGPAQLQYDNTGSALAAVSFDLEFSGCTGNEKRVISVSAVGRPETSKAAC